LALFPYFESYIRTQASFTKDELAYMQSLAIERKMKKRQLLLHEGEVCKYKGFVVKGLLRTYHTKSDGTESIMRFAPENWWCVEPESYNTRIPSKYAIDALEDSELIMWTREHVELLFAAIPAFRTFSEQLLTGSISAGLNRVLMNISYTAEEKYQAFVTSYPDVHSRVPLHMVASYLGLSRETLSRVRRAYSGKGKKVG
jgi:CRP-like cAMP-binding protein